MRSPISSFDADTGGPQSGHLDCLLPTRVPTSTLLQIIVLSAQLEPLPNVHVATSCAR
jgi:hypothetical protein